MQSHSLHHPSSFRSFTAGLPDAQVRRQTIEQSTPRDVPRNVMEALVAEEIDSQMQQLSLREQQILERSQIMGYALNRLPSLYVTSEKGWQRQWSHGKNKYQCQIKTAVRQGIAAVLRDPLRDVTILSVHPPDVAEAALAQLRRLLMRQELSWHNMVATIQMLLVNGDMQFPDERRSQKQAAAFSTGHSKKEPTAAPTGSKLSPEVEQEMETVLSEFFDWDAHPLHQRGF
jgi:hypothetical protein